MYAILFVTVCSHIPKCWKSKIFHKEWLIMDRKLVLQALITFKAVAFAK
jgi:hypothetical protein